jgi:hypothetical protein
MRSVLYDPKKNKVDTDALRATGIANGVWRESWNSLNPGMRRMNLANRLRALLRNSSETADVVLTDKDGVILASGRYGIARVIKEKKAKKKQS